MACLKAGSETAIASLPKTRLNDEPAPLWGSWCCIKVSARPDSVLSPPLFFSVPPCPSATIEPTRSSADSPSTTQRNR